MVDCFAVLLSTAPSQRMGRRDRVGLKVLALTASETGEML